MYLHVKYFPYNYAYHNNNIMIITCAQLPMQNLIGKLAINACIVMLSLL